MTNFFNEKQFIIKELMRLELEKLEKNQRKACVVKK